MILSVVVKLKDIVEQGKDYLWPRPDACPRCKGTRLWGHGFVRAYFDGFQEGVYLRRYRCPDCSCVIRLKPQGYFTRFQAPIELIRRSVCSRLETKRWLPHLSRTRQNHWFKALKRKAAAYFGNAHETDLLQAFDRLVRRGKIPVTRSI